MMNPETNRFEPVEESKLEKFTDRVIFSVGKEYNINGYMFKCAYIGETSILFEPVGLTQIGRADRVKQTNAQHMRKRKKK